MRFLGYFVFLWLISCAHTSDPVSLVEEEASHRDLAFFSPSTLSPIDNREMTLFYDKWAAQFKEAVGNYKSAIKQYRKVIRHFKKMSKFTSKRQDHLFRKHFKNASTHLKSAESFLERAKELRTTKPPFGKQESSQNISGP